MKTKTCPYCKEKIMCDAIVCRYCRRDLPEPVTEKHSTSLGWFAALFTTALLVGTSAVLVVDFLKERERWLKDQETKSTDE